ncbi:MAG: hypothetical protein OZ921_18300 [Sorangiineae bacterium]|nr:hypothetical protein [Polyangiaceae bacterium]MEB2324472.1 hypothetical protein [Sorangiineae bacterium]
MGSRLAAALTLVVAAGCDRGDVAPPGSASAPPAASLAPVARASAAPAAGGASSAPAPVAPATTCKGVTLGKLASLTARGGSFAGLAARAGSVYLLTAQQAAATATLTRVGRDGRSATVLGRSTGPGAVQGLALDDQAAYFVHGKRLVKVPLSGGEPVTLRTGVKWPLASSGGEVHYVACDLALKEDALMSLAPAGGEPRVRARWPRTGTSKDCHYGGLAVAPVEAFVSDWTSRTVRAISLTDGSVRELATQVAFPGRIDVEPAGVVFQASAGLFRVAKTGGGAVKLSDYGATPFNYLAWDERRFYIFDAEAYGERHVLHELPRDGGVSKEIEWFQVRDVTVGSGVADLAVDDSCIYLARDTGAFVELFAKPKP